MTVRRKVSDRELREVNHYYKTHPIAQQKLKDKEFVLEMQQLFKEVGDSFGMSRVDAGKIFIKMILRKKLNGSQRS